MSGVRRQSCLLVGAGLSFAIGVTVLSAAQWLKYDRSRQAVVPFGTLYVEENEGRYFWFFKSDRPIEKMSSSESSKHEITRKQFVTFQEYSPSPEATTFFGGFFLLSPPFVCMYLLLRQQQKTGSTVEDMFKGRSGVSAPATMHQRHCNPRLLMGLIAVGVLLWVAYGTISFFVSYMFRGD